jgi:hypothetical protein
MLNRAKISQAVTDCLNRCYASTLPINALAEFIDELNHDAQWSAYEVEAVEIRALRVLRRIVSDPAETSHLASKDPEPS